MRSIAHLDHEGKPIPYTEYKTLYNDDLEEVFVYWGRVAVNGSYFKDRMKKK